MPFIDPNGSSEFWYDGNTSTLVNYSSSTQQDVNGQSFWNNTQTTGFIDPTITVINYNTPKVYAVLIGF